MPIPPNASAVLEDWLNTLEQAFVETAVEAAKAGLDTDPDTVERYDRRLERIEANMARVHRAMDLCRKHEY